MKEPGSIKLDEGEILILDAGEVEQSYLRIIAKTHPGATQEGGNWRFPFRAALDLAHIDHMQHSFEFDELLARHQAQRGDSDPFLQRVLTQETDLTAPLPNGKTLMEHQRVGVEFLRTNPFCILADDMGLGKTLQALVVSKIIYEATGVPAVIITKACLVSDWQAEARAIKHPAFAVHSWGKIPFPTGRKIALIADEAHMAQTITSSRTKKLLALSTDALAVYCLTGTPMPNASPLNLFPLLKVIRHPLSCNQRHFEKYFAKSKIICGKGTSEFKIDESGEKPKISWKCRSCGHTSRFVFHWGIKKFKCFACGTLADRPKIFPLRGSDHLDELHEQTAPYILRRLKHECLDLPERTIVLRDLDISDEMKATFNREFSLAQDDYKARMEKGDVAKEALALATLTYIRKASSLAKVEPAIELGEEAIEEFGRVIIFTSFVASCEQIAKHFKVKPYHGGTSIADRNQIVADFQAKKLPAFVATTEAGGTGLTLTAANTVLFVDRPLTPGAAAQAVDRAHRIGQHWPVTGYWLRAFKICRKIDTLLISKAEIIERVLAGTQVSAGPNQIRASEVLRDLFSANE